MKRKWIMAGTVGVVVWMFILFMIAGLRGKDVNEMISEFIPDWELYSNIFWIISGGIGVIYVLMALIANIRRMIKNKEW